MELHIASAAAMEALGEQLARAIKGSCSIFLRGPLGAGKTTLVRGFLRTMGHTGTTRSPTYGLVETYHLSGYDIHHFDLYRLNDPGELENIGIRDYIATHTNTIYIVEWPENGAGVLPQADIEFNILYEGTTRKVLINSGLVTGQRSLISLEQFSVPLLN